MLSTTVASSSWLINIGPSKGRETSFKSLARFGGVGALATGRGISGTLAGRGGRGGAIVDVSFRAWATASAARRASSAAAAAARAAAASARAASKDSWTAACV